MTKDEVKKVFMLLKTAYNGFIPEDEDEAKAKLNLWELMFSRNSYSECQWAAQRCIETCVFPPTIADMKQWLGQSLTRDDQIARLPYKHEEPQYANEAYMEAMYQKALRMLEGDE